MSTEVLPANPKWLKWARTSVNYKDEVAKKLKIDPTNYSMGRNRRNNF